MLHSMASSNMVAMTSRRSSMVTGATQQLVMNNNGSSSVITARHDYLPFGEEIGFGTGMRTNGQGYGATDTNRQKYGLTERDDATGLDHTWFRKYDNRAGRMTSPDPYNGSMSTGDPQSFNRYSYVSNDPVNRIDPSGLTDDLTWFYQHGFDAGVGGFLSHGVFSPILDSEPHFSREMREAESTYSQRVSNAIGGNGFLTNEEVDVIFSIHYGYNEDGTLWTDFRIRVDVGI